jgi:hypothetical protein
MPPQASGRRPTPLLLGTAQCHFTHHKSPWTDLGSNPYLGGESPVNRKHIESPYNSPGVMKTNKLTVCRKIMTRGHTFRGQNVEFLVLNLAEHVVTIRLGKVNVIARGTGSNRGA